MGCVNSLMKFGVPFAVACSLIATTTYAAKEQHGRRMNQKAKNIIFMVPDGQGLSNVTAARIYKNGPNGAPLYQETLTNIGYQRTHSADSTVTDSAAAASAWAMGEKFNNGEISCHASETVTGSCDNLKPTILELAEKMGKSSGLVATSQVSHATPAAFGAHTVSRNCGAEIARQYMEESGVDVILGGGIYSTKEGYGCDAYEESYGAPDKRQYILDIAEKQGYTFVSDYEGMTAIAAASGKKDRKVSKVLGMFEQNGTGNGKTVEHFWINGNGDSYPEGEPILAEMTAAVLDILEKDKDGFFLLIEGSQIDWEDHGNSVEGQLAESLGFDEAVGEVLTWIDEEPVRRNNTLVIVVADHDTSGFAINGPYGELSTAGDIVVPGWTSTNHTAVDTIIYSQGPGSNMLNAALDNTDLYYVISKVLR